MQTFECQHIEAKDIQDFEMRLVVSSRDEILAIIRNITNRKQAERSLQESEAKFRSLTETTAAAIFIYQGDQNCYVNPTAKTLTGYTEAELLAMNFWDIIHPDFRDLVKRRGLARQQQEPVPSRYEIKILTKNGEERWIDVTLGLIKFDGRPAVLGTAFDITERKWATEALQKSETNLKAIFDNSLQAFILMDLNYTVQAFNRTTSKGVKLTLDKEIRIGSSIYEFVLDEDRDDFSQCLACVKTGESLNQEKRFNIEGVERWVEYHYNPVFSKEGQVVGICFSTVDIDERKRAADTLAASEARLLAEMQSVLSITRALVSEIHLDSLLNFITTQAKQLMRTDGAVVLLLSEDGQYLELAPVSEPPLILNADLQLPLQGSLAELAITTDKVQSSNQSANGDYIVSIRKLLAPAQIHSLWCAPLGVQGQTLGVLLLWSKKERKFTDRDSYLAHLFADQAALALYNARLHIENRKLAVEQERQRLARELHDSVTQSLYSIGMVAQASLRLLDKTRESKLEDPVKYIHQLSQVALAEMRERVYDLHPTVLKERELPRVLEGYCEMLSEQYGLTIDFKTEDNLKFSLYQRENLYYIAREALWNIVKHAGPTHVKVSLSRESKQFVLLIVDQGPGFALSSSQRTEMMGLRSMEERAKLLMGSFEIQSSPGTGTQITVRIPLQLP
jgi:PAS domain S-box-containing protein